MAKKEPPPPLPELPPMTEANLTLDNRLRKEGRKNDFHLAKQERYKELVKLGYSLTESKARAMHETWLKFPPIEVERSKWTPPKVDVGDKLAKLPALKDASSRDAAVLWVMNHPAMVREEVGPYSKIYLEAKDIDGCPNQAAWWMLSKAINNQDAFRKDAFTLLGKMGAKESGSSEDSSGDEVGDLTAMLKRMGDA